MNPAIIIRCPVCGAVKAHQIWPCRCIKHGGPERGAGTRGHTSGSPCAAARANHNSHRERNGAKASSAICHGPVFSVKRTVRAIIENVVAPGSVPDADTIKAVRIKFIRSLKALRSLLSLSAVHLRQEQSRGKAPVLHGSFLSAGPSGPVAVFDRHECSEREIPNDGKSEARPGNLTARDGKYAC